MNSVVDTSVDAESVQVGSGLFAFKDVSRGFYNLAALFAISIPVLVFPVPYLITRPCFPEKKSVDNITFFPVGIIPEFSMVVILVT